MFHFAFGTSEELLGYIRQVRNDKTYSLYVELDKRFLPQLTLEDTRAIACKCFENEPSGDREMKYPYCVFWRGKYNPSRNEFKTRTPVGGLIRSTSLLSRTTS